MPSLLLTSFGPWGEHRENASTRWWQEARWSVPEGWSVQHLVLPVDWEQAPRALDEALAALPDPAVIALCGLAESRTAITPERRARNRASTTRPDVRGQTFPHEAIEVGGRSEYPATLPLGPLVGALREAGIPSEESDDAGDYLCNFLSYRLLARLAARPRVRGGFIHVPPRACLSDAQWQAAAEVVIRTLTA